mmetsp:Transcript_15995/g.24579  ORF Transcript_15995/g.24579 Transcript_15995/m.24579 type:complete len:93 (+) Transcript_15995:657-935(+)
MYASHATTIGLEVFSIARFIHPSPQMHESGNQHPVASSSLNHQNKKQRRMRQESNQRENDPDIQKRVDSTIAIVTSFIHITEPDMAYNENLR